MYLTIEILSSPTRDNTVSDIIIAELPSLSAPLTLPPVSGKSGASQLQPGLASKLQPDSVSPHLLQMTSASLDLIFRNNTNLPPSLIDWLAVECLCKSSKP